MDRDGDGDDIRSWLTERRRSWGGAVLKEVGARVRSSFVGRPNVKMKRSWLGLQTSSSGSRRRLLKEGGVTSLDYLLTERLATWRPGEKKTSCSASLKDTHEQTPRREVVCAAWRGLGRLMFVGIELCINVFVVN